MRLSLLYALYYLVFMQCEIDIVSFILWLIFFFWFIFIPFLLAFFRLFLISLHLFFSSLFFGMHMLYTYSFSAHPSYFDIHTLFLKAIDIFILYNTDIKTIYL